MDLDDATTIADAIPTLSTVRARPMLSAERYDLGNPIGRGGMGEIFGARDKLIGRDVAIKRLRGEAPDRALERFMREACIQGRLEHPAIVPVHDLGVDADGVPYFVMKKLSGTTLAHVIAKPDPTKYSRQRLLRAFVDVCYAIELAHTRGCIHRDLKPANIVLGELGEVYVLDWGIAKVTGLAEPANPTPSPDSSELTIDGTAMGTPGYMSPEQARAEKDIDARSDVFSLGCVLFEILAGERMLPTSLSGVARALDALDARPSARAVNRDVPPELDAICVYATAVDRDARASSARELAVLVERYIDGDRDVEQRKKLAREHLDQATLAFTSSDTDSHRSAMRLAGRALALDPTLAGAAELVTRLMLEPPREIPEEVTQAVTQDRVADQRRIARVASFAFLAYATVFVMIAWLGFAAPAYPIVFSVLLVANVGTLAWYQRARQPRPILPMLLASGALVTLMARMFSPFLIGPGLAAVTAMAFSLGLIPLTRKATIAVIAVHVAAVLGPWIVEELGWITRTFELRTDSIVMFSPGLKDDAASHYQTNIYALAIYTVVLVATAVYLALGVRGAELRARHALHLQAWQLRQLVPVKVRVG